MILGDSNGNGTELDSTYKAVAIPAGWTVRDQGVNLATWPEIGVDSTLSVGCMPYLVARCNTAGATGGWIVRESENGRAAAERAGMITQLQDAFTNVSALADGDPEVIIWYMGANDSNNATESSQFYMNMLWAIYQVAFRYPNAHHVFIGERTTDGGPGGQYEFLAANLLTLALLALLTNGTFVNGTALVAPLTDAIHFSQNPGGGQSVIADNIPIGST